VLILSTGFNALSYMRPMALTGSNGVDIEAAWKHKIEAYRSVLLKDYPNFFLMLGPHTPIANFSIIAMSEVQGDYIMQLIDKWMQGDFDTVSPKQEAITAYQQFIRDGLSGSTWASGCQSWYLDADGDAIVWPYSWASYVESMSQPIFSDLDLRKQDAPA
jgi:cation diffusion facilitator CzcD-associated flavoprotein CzcO